MQKKRLESLHALRGIAFLGLFLTHCEIVPNLGGWGVSIFLVLSGFLMMYSYDGRMDVSKCSLYNNLCFAKEKIKKLYPLHIFMLFVTLPIVLVQMKLGKTDLSLAQLGIQFVLQILLVQTWVPMQIYYFSLNGLSWYLSVAFFCYFIFPWIYRCIINMSTKKLFLLAICIYALMFGAITLDVLAFAGNEDLSTYFTYVCPLLRIGDFACGCICGTIFIRKPNLRSRTATLFEVITIICIIGGYYFINLNHYTILTIILSRNVTLFLPTSCIIVYLFATGNGKVSQLLTNKMTLYLGDISPYGYLIHQKVIAYLIVIFTYVLKHPLNNGIRMILTGLITWILINIYLLIENKMRRINRVKSC